MTSTELYTTAATQARAATEKAVDTFKKGAQTFTEQADLVAKLPTVDLTTPVQRYFDLVQQTLDRNREFATKWAELVTSLSSTFREQAQSLGNVVKEQTAVVTEQAERAEQVAEDQAAAAEQAEKDLVKQAQKAEREAAKKVHEEARAAYEGLTKAELSDQLAERELPKSGTVDELIERLVSADSQ